MTGIDEPYRAMRDSPWSILVFWNGAWLFGGCYDDEEPARDSFDSVSRMMARFGVDAPMVLRHRTQVLERWPSG